MPTIQQDWRAYSWSLLISNVIMWLATFPVVSIQQVLPLNPDGIAGMEPTLAFNTISSFTTNTNLQHYSGESGLSYLSQMVVVLLPAVRDGGHRRRRSGRGDARSGRQSTDDARQLLRRR